MHQRKEDVCKGILVLYVHVKKPRFSPQKRTFQKRGSPKFFLHITLLFQAAQNYVPKSFCEVLTSCIPKRGKDPSVWISYRSITVCSIRGKLKKKKNTRFMVEQMWGIISSGSEEVLVYRMLIEHFFQFFVSMGTPRKNYSVVHTIYLEHLTPYCSLNPFYLSWNPG